MGIEARVHGKGFGREGEGIQKKVYGYMTVAMRKGGIAVSVSTIFKL